MCGSRLKPATHPNWLAVSPFRAHFTTSQLCTYANVQQNRSLGVCAKLPTILLNVAATPVSCFVAALRAFARLRRTQAIRNSVLLLFSRVPPQSTRNAGRNEEGRGLSDSDVGTRSVHGAEPLSQKRRSGVKSELISPTKKTRIASSSKGFRDSLPSHSAKTE